MKTKREHLLDTAFALFSREGFHAVGIDTVLAKAGVAKMTLYHHFKSKEALIAAVLERRAGEIAAEIEAKVEAKGSPRERVLAVFAWLDDWFREPGFHGCLFIKAAGEYPAKAELPRQAAVAFKQACQDLLEKLCADLKGVADPRALARQLALLVEGASVLAFIHRRPDAAADAREAASALLRAHGVR